MADSCLYMMASQKWGTIYIGSTTNPIARVWQHRNGLLPGLTSKHQVKKRVWYEVYGCLDSAATRERQMKKRRREWKMRLRKRTNQEWRDLWDETVGAADTVDKNKIRE